MEEEENEQSLCKKLNLENVFHYFRISSKCSYEELLRKCVCFVRENCENVFKNPKFFELNRQELQYILSSIDVNKFNTEQRSVIQNSLIEWSKCDTFSENLDSNGQISENRPASLAALFQIFHLSPKNTCSNEYADIRDRLKRVQLENDKNSSSSEMITRKSAAAKSGELERICDMMAEQCAYHKESQSQLSLLIHNQQEITNRIASNQASLEIIVHEQQKNQENFRQQLVTQQQATHQLMVLHEESKIEICQLRNDQRRIEDELLNQKEQNRQMAEQRNMDKLNSERELHEQKEINRKFADQQQLSQRELDQHRSTIKLIGDELIGQKQVNEKLEQKRQKDKEKSNQAITELKLVNNQMKDQQEVTLREMYKQQTEQRRIDEELSQQKKINQQLAQEKLVDRAKIDRQQFEQEKISKEIVHQKNEFQKVMERADREKQRIYDQMSSLQQTNSKLESRVGKYKSELRSQRETQEELAWEMRQQRDRADELEEQQANTRMYLYNQALRNHLLQQHAWNNGNNGN